MRARILSSLVCLLAVAGPASGQTQWPADSPPRPLAARSVQFPPYERHTLPNGLQVIVVLHHEQPVVSMRMIVGAGGARDPKGKLGLANLLSALLTQGTTEQTANELNEAVDFIGGAMGAGSGSDMTLLNMIVMKDSFQLGLKMLSDIARRPAFAQAEIDRQRQQMLSALKVSFEDPEFVADAVFQRLVYGFNPYGLPQTGTPESIAGITRADLVDFHQRHFVPNNAVIAVVGDVTGEEALDGVRKAFGDWQRKEIPAEAFMAPPDATRRIIVVNKPDAVQTEIRVGHVGVPRKSDDYLSLNLATRILGGEGANRLHQVLRTERGLTYGAQAAMHALRESGDFEASTNTRSEATGEVLRLIVEEFWRIQRDRVNERELSEAKAYITGSFPLTIETPDAIATQVLNVVFYGRPVEEVQTFRDRVNAITVDEVQRVARSYYRPDRLSIVLVGNAKAFASQLRGIGFNAFETVDMSSLDLTTVDFKRAGARAASLEGAPGLVVRDRARAAYAMTSAVQSGRAPSTDAEAGALLDRIIAAKGGIQALRGVASITAETKAAMKTPSGPMEAATTTYLQYPNHVRVETTLAEATIVQVYDGTRAWVKDPGGTHDVPAPMLRELQASFDRDTIAVLLAAKDGKIRVRQLPDSKPSGVDAKAYNALEFSGGTLEPMVLYVDPSTHLVARQTYVPGGAGQPLVEEIFSGYRPVDGIQIAFRAEVRRGGETILERSVTTIRLNESLAPDLFKRPS